MSSSVSLCQPLLLENRIQHYAWGRHGQDSIIHRLLGLHERHAPAAELWIGAHPKAPSTAIIGQLAVPLDRLIAEHPDEILGPRVRATFYSELPFLFKILSIRTALSIQAHPDKRFAGELHTRMPEHYPDKNHKPEMAIALSEVELLYGFAGLAEIKSAVGSFPGLQQLLGDSLSGRLLRSPAVAADRELIQDIYTALMRSQADQVAETVSGIEVLLRSKSHMSRKEKWFLTLSSEFPSDIGLLALFFLNHVVLAPGAAVFIGPNFPHAYLLGDLVECMANSDNVVRAGLTPKFQDVDTLLAMLSFQSAIPENVPGRELAGEPGRLRFAAPAKEFALEMFQSPGKFQLQSGSPKILFCVEGEGTLNGEEYCHAITAGQAWLVPAVCSTSFEFSGGRAFMASVP